MIILDLTNVEETTILDLYNKIATIDTSLKSAPVEMFKPQEYRKFIYEKYNELADVEFKLHIMISKVLEEHGKAPLEFNTYDSRINTGLKQLIIS